MSYYLTIKDDELIVSYGDFNDPDIFVVKSVEAYDEFLAEQAEASGVDIDELSVMESSSMHFPDEATSNLKTIELAKAVSTGGMLKYFNQPA